MEKRLIFNPFNLKIYALCLLTRERKAHKSFIIYSSSFIPHSSSFLPAFPHKVMFLVFEQYIKSSHTAIAAGDVLLEIDFVFVR